MNSLPELLNLWTGGQLLAFSGLDGTTDFDHGLIGRTSLCGTEFTIRFPGTITVRISDQAPQRAVLGGDFFEVETDLGITRGVFVDTHHLLLDGPCSISDSCAELAVCMENTRTLIAATESLDKSYLQADFDALYKSRQRWLLDAPLPEDAPTATRKALAKAFSMMKTQVYTPDGIIAHRWTTPDRWPHRRMWLWDSVFHAIGWRHLDPKLARDMISAVFDTQKPNGFIAHMMDPHEISHITQPPILALGVMLVHEVDPQPDWIAELYPKLDLYLKWDFANRDKDRNGLCEWFIEGDSNCRSGESGMDNSPRFDCAAALDATDFNAFLALEAEIMAEFAAILDKPVDAERWVELHETLCQKMNDHLWDDTRGFYMDYNIETQALSPVLAHAGFLPLLCGAPTREQAKRLVAHLSDPQMFGTPVPIPSIAACDTASYSKDMWRGPVWINMNWLIARGLDRYGYTTEAQTLREKTVREIERWHAVYGTFFEFFDDKGTTPPPEMLRKGKCAPEIGPGHQVFFDYGWSATLYVDLILDALRK